MVAGNISFRLLDTGENGGQERKDGENPKNHNQDRTPIIAKKGLFARISSISSQGSPPHGSIRSIGITCGDTLDRVRKNPGKKYLFIGFSTDKFSTKKRLWEG
jgi:hypothetical protein